MKKLLLITVSILCMSATNAAAGKLAFPLIGKWNPTDPPLTLSDPYGLQDIQNLRRRGNSLVSVNGHTVIDDSYPYAIDSAGMVTGMYHFTKDTPYYESHVLVGSAHGLGGPVITYRLYTNDTTPPSAGSYESSAVLSVYNTTPETGDGLYASMAQMPRGVVFYCDGHITRVWGGDYNDPLMTILADGLVSSNPQTPLFDVTDELTVSKGDGQGDFYTASWGNSGAGRVLLIGSPYVLDSAYFKVDTGNTVTASLSMKAYQVGGWASVTIADGTSSSGRTMFQSGWVTWTADYDDTVIPILLHDLYWYEFTIPSGTANVILDRVMTHFPAQAITNIWDGETTPIVAWGRDFAGVPADYSKVPYLQTNDETTYTPVSYTAGSDNIFGFAVPVRGIRTMLVEGEENGTSHSPVPKIYYYGESGWTEVSNAVGVLNESTPLGRSGDTTWDAQDWNDEIPFIWRVGPTSDQPYYYYRQVYQSSQTCDVDTNLYYVVGIPRTQPLRYHGLTRQYGNRAWLLNEVDGRGHVAHYSAYGAPHIWNGSDSGEVEFGSSGEIMGAATVFNVFSSSGYVQFVVFKRNETWRLLGIDPESWDLKQVSSVIGCVSPGTIAECGIHKDDQTASRQVVIWLSSSGVQKFDGASIKNISKDIRGYFDPNSSLYVAAATQVDARGWYDPELNAYKLILGTLELEYSLEYESWTKIYREDSGGANPLVVGSAISSPTGEAYNYGVTGDGSMFRLENGHDWEGEADITSYFRTKELMLDEDAPFFHSTRIDWMRLLLTGVNPESSLATDISVEHYCNGVPTTTANDQVEPTDASVDYGPALTYDVTLGPCKWHSIKINDTDDAEVRFHGLGLVYESDNVITE